jgi:hypothetical protein
MVFKPKTVFNKSIYNKNKKEFIFEFQTKEMANIVNTLAGRSSKLRGNKVTLNAKDVDDVDMLLSLLESITEIK